MPDSSTVYKQERPRYQQAMPKRARACICQKTFWAWRTRVVVFGSHLLGVPFPLRVPLSLCSLGCWCETHSCSSRLTPGALLGKWSWGQSVNFSIKTIFGFLLSHYCASLCMFLAWTPMSSPLVQAMGTIGAAAFSLPRETLPSSKQTGTLFSLCSPSSLLTG